MKARDYFMREGQACASTQDVTRLNLAVHRAPSRQARGWLLAGYHMQAGGYRKLIERLKGASLNPHNLMHDTGPAPWRDDLPNVWPTKRYQK